MADQGRRPRRVMTTELKRSGSLADDLVYPVGERSGLYMLGLHTGLVEVVNSPQLQVRGALTPGRTG